MTGVQTCALPISESFCAPEFATPYKDNDYINHRYFKYPTQKYEVYGGMLDGVCRLVFCVKRMVVNSSIVLRITDIIGTHSLIPQFGNALDNLLLHADVEYIDCYCFGVDAETMERSGFLERSEDDEAIIPHYLSPPLIENIEFYGFTQSLEGFNMFLSDGDNDRPNLI